MNTGSNCIKRMDMFVYYLVYQRNCVTLEMPIVICR